MSGSPESGYTDWSNLIPETVNLLMLQRLKLSIVALFRRSGLHRRGLDVPRLLWHIHVRQLQSLAGVTADLIGQRRAVVESRSEEHTSELQSRENLVCRLLLE